MIRLVADYVRPYRGRRRYEICRIRIFYDEENSFSSTPVVICSEVPDNSYLRVRSVAEYMAAEVIVRHSLLRPIWIEHYPPESNAAYAQTFDLVTFSSYELQEVLVAGMRRVKVGAPEWKPIDRATVEVLIGLQL